ncbi:putative phospholipid-transporting ATPase 8 [Drosera capensis]
MEPERNKKNKKRAIRLSKLYSFSCFKSRFNDEHSRIGQLGFNRVVYCNDPDECETNGRVYGDNYVSTTKYTALNFVPKSLVEQFRRVANAYFVVVACVSFSPLAPYTAVSVLAPLVVVIGATMAKEAVEDWKRKKQDIEANNREVEAYDKIVKAFVKTKWKQLRVGDVLKVYKDEYFPADLLLLSSSYEDGICYVETSNLDGETNLKLKHSLEATSSLHDDTLFQDFKAVVKCEDPNERLFSFVGTLYLDDKQYPLSVQQLLLRDSKLRNTEYAYGVVIFTGHDTKVMQNATAPPSKRSRTERTMDKIIYLLFGILFVMGFVGSVYFGIETKRDDIDGKLRRWYLRPDAATVLFDPKRASLAAVFHFLSALMLYGYLIPISLYISIEIVKVAQSIFINQDRDMYYEETDRPARARTSNLIEELGQVYTILSDKTGTLTCNSMEFIKCFIAGTAYGQGMTEVEIALANGIASPGSRSVASGLHEEVKSGCAVKGYNFKDERLMNGNWVKEANPMVIEKFLLALALCHTAIPDVHEDSGEISYEAESPDEAAFVIAARELGFQFYRRTQTSISLYELDYKSRERINREYELLHVLEFSSSRKRMSVILRSEENQLLLFSKGADSVMFERLSETGRRFEAETKECIRRYAEAGLRTLVVAYRELSHEEYKHWEVEFTEASNSVTADRNALVDSVANKIEKDLILLGATAVEDKLQKGVPECIDKLFKAGIKIWVLTGDKMETAINIGYACGLLRQGMKNIEISLDLPEINALEKLGNKDAVTKASLENVKKQISDAVSQITAGKGNSSSFGLIIDGTSLSFALDKNLEKSFLKLALSCESVLCCRSSPKQKALVTRLVKIGTGKTTLAIGDGANDVGMLQEADIGVGISGMEGMQAVMASDYAIAQFRFLERLLLVHGHWCYRRITMMICYFFYKNITFGLTLFWFEYHASFSAKPAYNDWYMSSYNVFFTSLPVIALGVFDQDVSARLCLKYPFLYQVGVQNKLFRWRRILGWMSYGAISSIIIYFLTTAAISPESFRKDGQVPDISALGTTMYSSVVWTVNCQMALTINYFTLIQHVVVWGSIIFWYVFLIVYGYVPPRISTTAYHVLVEACAPSPKYWLVTLLVTVSALLPYFTYRAVQTWFTPMYHDIIRNKEVDDSDTRSSPTREGTRA